MTHLTSGRTQLCRAGGARQSQQSFLPLVFLERALPVLKAAQDPCLLTRPAGISSGASDTFFLAEVRRCTSKKSHELQPAAGPEGVWTGAPFLQAQIPSPDVPETSTAAVPRRGLSLSAERLGLGRYVHTGPGGLRVTAPRHYQCGCSPHCCPPPPAGGQPLLTEATAVRLSLCSRSTSRFPRNQTKARQWSQHKPGPASRFRAHGAAHGSSRLLHPALGTAPPPDTTLPASGPAPQWIHTTKSFQDRSLTHPLLSSKKAKRKGDREQLLFAQSLLVLSAH